MGLSPLVFVHAPKTGGSTVVAIARRQYPAAAVAAVPGPLATARATLAQQPVAARARLRFLHGHVPYGIHTELPEAPRYLTFLRHPVTRMLSVYYYGLRRPEWPIHEVIRTGQLTLEQFVDSDAAAEFNNGQTRFLAGSDASATRDTLAAAIDNLTARVDVVGITERFDESLLLCRRRFGWRRSFYRRENVNYGRPGVADIPARVVTLIERRNAFDLELYAAGRRALDAALAAEPAIAGELRWFQAVNRVYDRTSRAAGRLSDRVRQARAGW